MDWCSGTALAQSTNSNQHLGRTLKCFLFTLKGCSFNILDRSLLGRCGSSLLVGFLKWFCVLQIVNLFSQWKVTPSTFWTGHCWEDMGALFSVDWWRWSLSAMAFLLLRHCNGPKHIIWEKVTFSTKFYLYIHFTWPWLCSWGTALWLKRYDLIEFSCCHFLVTKSEKSTFIW